ncbi:MAG: hypothetical protein K2P14_03640 [Anaeroplasmataceae bacterium]|nr:hypothetical protein [Anaeroplasmataceae bacterium]
MKTFKLCFVEGEDYSGYGVAYFTDNLEKQWGDDWDDAPYEHNAETPYHEWSELIEDNEDVCKRKWKHHPIEIKKIYFELNDYKVPCSGMNNSPYSVQDINNGVVAWLWNDNFKLFAGVTMTEFIDTIKANGGKIYTEE